MGDILGFLLIAFLIRFCFWVGWHTSFLISFILTMLFPFSSILFGFTISFMLVSTVFVIVVIIAGLAIGCKKIYKKLHPDKAD